MINNTRELKLTRRRGKINGEETLISAAAAAGAAAGASDEKLVCPLGSRACVCVCLWCANFSSATYITLCWSPLGVLSFKQKQKLIKCVTVCLSLHFQPSNWNAHRHLWYINIFFPLFLIIFPLYRYFKGGKISPCQLEGAKQVCFGKTDFEILSVFILYLTSNI